MHDPFHLQRFIDAQHRQYDSVLRELRSGQKRSHWIWYIFPQITGLGFSATSQRYAITSLEEALAYWQHPILGARLLECTQLVMNIEGRSAEQIFQHPDHLKFRSCMTLFAQVATDNPIFQNALVKYFDGEPDERTLEWIRHSPL